MSIYIVGFFIGTILQRSRISIVSIFRDTSRSVGPISIVAFKQLQGLLILLLITTILSASTIYSDLHSIELKNFGIMSFIGGLVFGLGMSLTNACTLEIIVKSFSGYLRELISFLIALTMFSLTKYIGVDRVVNSIDMRISLVDIIGIPLTITILIVFIAITGLIALILEFRLVNEYRRRGLTT